jgi:hypothetical protein
MKNQELVVAAKFLLSDHNRKVICRNCHYIKLTNKGFSCLKTAKIVDCFNNWCHYFVED